MNTRARAAAAEQRELLEQGLWPAARTISTQLEKERKEKRCEALRPCQPACWMEIRFCVQEWLLCEMKFKKFLLR